jgi:hypothetical protein
MIWFNKIWFFKPKKREPAPLPQSYSQPNYGSEEVLRVKDISEPVLAIVECMKKYPSRFKLKAESTVTELQLSVVSTYTVTDLKTKQEIVVTDQFNPPWL